MEAYAELFLAAILNAEAMGLTEKFSMVVASDWLTGLTLIINCMIPLILIVILWRNRNNLASQLFQAKYGIEEAKVCCSNDKPMPE